MDAPEDAITVQKTPAGEWDETINWGCPSRQLADDLIATSEWSVSGPDSDLELYDPEISTDKKMTTTWMRGGTVGGFYEVTNKITTEDLRVFEGTFVVQVVSTVYLAQPRVI